MRGQPRYKFATWLASCGIDIAELGDQALFESYLATLPPGAYARFVEQMELKSLYSEADLEADYLDAERRMRELLERSDG